MVCLPRRGEEKVEYRHGAVEKAIGRDSTHAISRVTSSANIKILSAQGPDGYVRHVVHKEVLEM